MAVIGTQQPRVIAYIDGFNLYFGLREMGWRRYYWLDVHALAASLIPADTDLVATKYFTTRIASPPDKHKRQSDYLEALLTATPCEIIYGKYQIKTHFCQSCGFEERIPNEKMTDVNIAVEMMEDAFQDNFDVALLISGDSDLTPPVSAIRRRFPEKRVVVACPPRRKSAELSAAASSVCDVVRTKLRDSQMPDEVQKQDGYTIKRPSSWKKLG